MTSFEDLVGAATGFLPYAYQRRLAEEGPAEVLEVPTGAGKTLAAVLPWLYRRRFHPDPHVRQSTPRRLVLVLPMRVLVEQTVQRVQEWLERLGAATDPAFDVAGAQVQVVMGGDRRSDDGWRLQPDADTVLIGTLDMLLSRALNRGYAQSRWAWPIDFGLLNSDCHWVFDEIQLMGPALPTSRQLQAFRKQFGTAAACTSMWMSATVDAEAMSTVDNPDIGAVGRITVEDAQGPLRDRLEAPKRVEELYPAKDARDAARALAPALVERHRPGTLTLAMLNTVQRAQDLHAALLKQATAVPVFLVHSRFRPADRRRVVEEAITAPVSPDGPGRIVVATQVLEAGVDLSAATLVTEAASWPSLVQRAGRCNRYAEAPDAQLLWLPPPRPEPYDPRDVDQTVVALRRLEGTTVTPRSLLQEPVKQQRVDHPVLRRKDLVELFDTAPDLSGDDLDIGRYLRDADDVDVLISWRDNPKAGDRSDMPVPTREELCPVPVGQARDWLRKRGARAFRLDPLEARWEQVADLRTLRPGHVLIVAATAGGYLPERGWDPVSGAAVETLQAAEASALAPADEAVLEDPVTYATRRWVPLTEHLADVEREVRILAQALELRPAEAPLGEVFNGVTAAHLEAAVIAARLHDVGKAHPVFQQTMKASADDDGKQPDVPGPWAKSGGSRWERHGRAHFRHELVSALALLDSGAVLLNGAEEPDLIRYLVAAHHGRVRLAIRSLPDEDPHPEGAGRRVALGVHDGETFGPVEIPGGMVPKAPLDLSVMEIGTRPDGQPSWTSRTLALRDREDLGPFRLAMLEALVRLADWRASRAAEEVSAR